MPEHSISSPGLMLLVFVPFAGWVIWTSRRRHHTPIRLLAGVALAAWSALLLYGTLVPVPLPPYNPLDSELLNMDYRAFPAAFLSLTPFTTITASLGLGLDWPAARYLVGNFVAFVPLGMLAPLTAPRWDSWLRIGALGLAISILVETVQLGESLLVSIPIHVADIDDLILNTLGALVGYGLLRAVKRHRKADEQAPESPAAKR